MVLENGSFCRLSVVLLVEKGGFGAKALTLTTKDLHIVYGRRMVSGICMVDIENPDDMDAIVWRIRREIELREIVLYQK